MNLPELLRRHRLKIATGVLLVAATWFLLSDRGSTSRDALVAFVKGLPMAWFIAAFMILPLAGFPISLFLILIGVRFGFANGMAVVAGTVLFHHFTAYHLVHGSIHDWVSLRVKRAGYAIPAIRTKHRIGFTILFTAVHGLPYFLKLYLLALTNIPLRIYIGAGASVHILFCALPVGVGAAAIRLDSKWIEVLVGVSVVIIFGGYWLHHRFVIPASECDEAS